jgi:uncharacterized protein
MIESFRAGLALAAALVLSSGITSWSYLHAKRFEQTIQVTGSAKKRIKSDVMVWQASVTAESRSLPDAYGKLSRDVATTQAFLVAHGVPAEQIVVSAVTTTPIRRTARQAGNRDDEDALTGTVTGYSLKQSLAIHSADIDRITAVSRQVTELINQGILLESDEPQYLYTRLAETKVQILAEAAHDARERAAQIAASAGSHVGEIRSAEMGVIQITPADSNNVSDYGENDTKSLEKDVNAVVHMSFSLD